MRKMGEIEGTRERERKSQTAGFKIDMASLSGRAAIPIYRFPDFWARYIALLVKER